MNKTKQPHFDHQELVAFSEIEKTNLGAYLRGSGSSSSSSPVSNLINETPNGPINETRPMPLRVQASPTSGVLAVYDANGVMILSVCKLENTVEADAAFDAILNLQIFKGA